MHRFRKKSETGRSSQAPSLSIATDSDERDTSLQVPLPNDFRTSLILPDLSRRFSLLRTPTGEPVALDVLKQRLADQRARGAVNQISEEEEDMIFDSLRGFRSKSSGSGQLSDENLNVTESDDFRHSTSTVQSSGSPSTTSVPSSPSGRSTKRYTNNLFGSGRFNDYNYMRSVTRNTGSRTTSLTPTESSYNRVNGNTSSVTESLRPVTPESTDPADDTQSSPNTDTEIDSSARTAPVATPYSEPLVSVADYRISKTLGPSVLKRASMAIEQVIKEFEEEAEDEILMPRSTPIPRTNAGVPQSLDPMRNSGLSQSSIFEAVMAISSDKQVQNDPEVIDKRASPVPSRILPGYVPGMPRPMTPRDFDLDEQRSLSTTPRATSPIATSFPDNSVTSKTSVSPIGRHRSNSSASQSGPRSPTSPLFLQRSPNNGRYTPEDNSRSTEFDSPSNSSLLARRRPASPLANPPFQPMSVSARPSTPSNVIWNTNAGHGRNDSWTSDGGSDIHNALDRYTSIPRSVHSPPLPDSPIEGVGPNLPSLGASYSSVSFASENDRPAATITVNDLGSPRQQSARSPTPTQNATRSPTSPSFGDSGMSGGSTRPSTKQSTFSHSIPPLVFSPLVNSSRLSLESTGSSYHTWEGEDKDRSLSLFNDPDTLQSVWHDLSPSSPATLGDSPEDSGNPDEVVARIAGLKKSDLIAIQEKLVTAKDAKGKEIKQEPQERAASSLRKRRPSTSQSNYSYNVREPQVASPPPQSQISPPKITTVSHHKNDGLSTIETHTLFPTSPREGDKDLSPTSRRKRDLTRALFGQEDAESEQIPKPAEQILRTTPSADQSQKLSAPNLDTHSSSSTLSPPVVPYQLTRNPSTPRIPQTAQEQAQLVQEVQEKINAATQFLKPANGGHSPDPSSPASRKRIDPSQISTPRLVAASTSVVDTVPIVKAPSISSANSSGPSKIGSRFKKLRGTLRAKNPPPNGEEITPYPLDVHSPPSSQMLHYDPAKLKVPGPDIVTSATESRFKVTVPSPPASAGPGLKGFMARWRGKQRSTVDIPAEPEHRKSPLPQTPPSNNNPASQPTTPVPAVSSNANPNVKTSPQSVSGSVGRKPVPTSRPETPQVQPAPPAPLTYGDSSPPNESAEAALRQLFEAANKFGIDQGELNALLARSGSTSSKSDWNATMRGNPANRTGATSPSDLAMGRPSIDDQNARGLTPDLKAADRGMGRPSLDGRDKPVSRQTSRRQAEHTRRPRETKGDNNAVVRKTIIVPDTVMTANELKTFMEKSLPGRRASITSTSSRSIHDRAPTPPPPRSPTYKRFSNGPSPPLPNLPAAALGNSLSVPSTSAGGSIEKSSSAYDSLYDMYAGESRSPSATPNEAGPSRVQEDLALESGAAVELIHLANGETIWNIVNGLREDDDDESVYTRRTSFASEYAPRGANGDGGIQVFVKEHGRSGSKGSTSSFLSRKRTSQGKQRPETKVFYSPTEGIGRLIQDLSQNMEAGSFNFTPRPGHSASSSLSTNDMTWTLEQRLDEMIDTVRV